MTGLAQLAGIINTAAFVIGSIAHLGGVVVAVILVVRRATVGRWLVLVGIAVPALASLCGGLLSIGAGAAAGPLGLNMEGYMTLTTVNNVCGVTLEVLGYVTLLIGIWLLAHEGRADAVNENA